MWKGSTIFLGLMLTGSLAAAALVSVEDAQTGEVVAPAAGKASRREAVQPVLPVLQLDKLVRTDASEPEQDPFAGKSWYVPPPPPPQPAQEAPRPTAPPLLFGYMGRMQEEDGQAVVYLTQGSRAYSVSQGDTIDGTYRVDSISPAQVTLVYLPLNIRQSLNIGSANLPELERMASAAGMSPERNEPLPDSGSAQIAGSMPR
ncbi:MAG: hypothetical protein HY936_08405 [Nitrosomonadales bacterium]|nr:hypothetical protein [Nitrosomonadales bacterium]